MKACKWTVLVVTGGLLFSLSSCATALGDTLVTYLPDLLDAWLTTVTTTT
jgi:hypothetical protein